MSRYEVADLPMTTLPDGRYFISSHDAMKFLWVRQFIDLFSDFYWKPDPLRDGWISPTPEELQDSESVAGEQ